MSSSTATTDLAISDAAEWGRAWYAHQAGNTAYRPLPDYGRDNFLATTANLCGKRRLELLLQGWPEAPLEIREIFLAVDTIAGMVRLDSLPIGSLVRLWSRDEPATIIGRHKTTAVHVRYADGSSDLHIGGCGCNPLTEDEVPA